MSQFSTNYIRWEFSIFSKSRSHKREMFTLHSNRVQDDVDEPKYIVHDRTVK